MSTLAHTRALTHERRPTTDVEHTKDEHLRRQMQFDRRNQFMGTGAGVRQWCRRGYGTQHITHTLATAPIVRLNPDPVRIPKCPPTQAIKGMLADRRVRPLASHFIAQWSAAGTPCECL